MCFASLERSCGDRTLVSYTRGLPGIGLAKLCTSLTKECCTGTVLLHLITAVMGRRAPEERPCKPIPALYIPVPSPFPSLEAFIYEATKAYNLDLFHCLPPEGNQQVESVTEPSSPSASSAQLPGHPSTKAKGGEGMKSALAVYKARFPHIEAILIGTRRTDPHGGAFPSMAC